MSENDLKIEQLKLEENDIKDLSLIDKEFFSYAINNNKELAEVMVKPALNYLGIKNYEIIAVRPEDNSKIFVNQGVRINVLIKREDNSYMMFEIQTGYPEPVSAKQIRYEHGLFDNEFLIDELSGYIVPDIVSVIYVNEPHQDFDNGNPINDIALINMATGEIAPDYGRRTLIVNNKYKTKESEEFTNVIEDLLQANPEKIKNPVIRKILLETKSTEKGRDMLSEFIEEKYKNIIRKNQQLYKQLQENQVELEEANRKIEKYKHILKENGIAL